MYVALVFNERFRESKCNFPLRPHQRKFRLIPSDLSLTVTSAHISLASFDMSERERMINDSVFFSRFLLDFFFFYFDCYCFCNASCFTKPFEVWLEKSCLRLQCSASAVVGRSREPYMVLPAQLPT